MMVRRTVTLCWVVALLTGAVSVSALAAEATPLVEALRQMPGATASDFAQPDAGTGATLSRFGDGPGAVAKDGMMGLLHGVESERNVIAFERTAAGLHGRVDARFRFRCERGADGWAFALLSTQHFGAGGAGPDIEWEEPNLTGSFGVGFDIYNPPSDNRFDASGNIYGRPEREISLHWDAKEVANALCPVEFRDGALHEAAITVQHVVGGAYVSVQIDDARVYDREFIPELQPYESRVAIGARSGGVTTHLAIDDLAAAWTGPAAPPAKPERCRLFDGTVIHGGNRQPTDTVRLPAADLQVGRIIASVTLAAPPGGFDPWDRSAAVYAWGDDGERYEILRYITPFGRSYTWKADVTDYQSLLRGERKVGLYISTWMEATTPETQKGWKVTVDLDYYPGIPEREAFAVNNVWSGEPEYGNPDKPMDDFLAQRSLPIPPETTGAKLRLMVTGHGQSPNTKGAGEFMPAKRVLSVNGTEFTDTLWKTDCYLNPCRPQGGTWKFDRAGWAPGSVVEPWDVDISSLVVPGKDCVIGYTPEPYVNENRTKSKATHWVEGQLILYRD